MSFAHATFTSLDDSDLRFEVQYNPAKLKRSWKPEWTPDTAIGSNTPYLEYAKTPPRKLSMELYFDTTNSSPLRSVEVAYLRPFFAFATPTVLPREGWTKKRRPHWLLFTWSKQAFQGVVSSIDTTEMMFSSCGLPIRASVALELSEHNPALRDHHRSLGRSWSPPPGFVSAACGGTVSEVAAQLGTTERQLLAHNDILDPMNIPPGMPLVVR